MEKKYHEAMRRVLHKFNKAKRAHDVDEAVSAIDCMRGIRLVAIADDQIPFKDFAKMAQIDGAMLKKLWDI